MVGRDNVLIQVRISKVTYEYLKKFRSLFGVSISEYCNQAIVDRIINGDNKNAKTEN